MNKKIIKVLIVEDDISFGKIILRKLSNIDTYSFETTLATSLNEAFSHEPNNGKFDVILLDLNLPDSSEMKTVIAMREKAPSVPIVVISSVDNEELMINCVQQGVQDYIIKGNINSFELSKSVRFAMERHKLILEKAKLIEKLDSFAELLKNEIEASLKNQQTLIGSANTSITAQMVGVGPLSIRSVITFNNLVIEYSSLLKEYLEALGFNQQPPRRDINIFAKKIGDNGGGPQDVVDIHLKVVTKITNEINPKRARIITMEGRLLALEVMGNLVDYYKQTGSLPKVQKN